MLPHRDIKSLTLNSDPIQVLKISCPNRMLMRFVIGKAILVSWAALFGWAPMLVAQQPDLSDETQQQLEFFESKIRPVLVAHCYECHSADSAELQGGLRVDSRATIRTGGDSGPAVVPGKPGDSLLLEALRYESYEMPPAGQLADHIIADFETWIRSGAVDPRDSDTVAPAAGVGMEQGRAFWSFQPIASPTVPDVKNESWPLNEIDRFVLSRLEENQLAPVNDANQISWLRRVYFDLIGLPPKPQQIDEFLNDLRPNARSRLIDQLLDSPQFGERWARHWLDVARYSDSSGGGRVLIFHDAWRYRDYVINAFNADKPFDQFVREQVAGDLLPYHDYLQRREQLTATGFLMLGPHNYELQDKELLRMEVVDEQIDVMGRAFLGLTLGCARCHDHKFDPVPTEDYYALAGIFRSTDSLVHANVSRFVETELPLPPREQQALQEYRATTSQLQQKIDNGKKQIDELLKRLSETGSVPSSNLGGLVLDDQQAQLTGTWNHSDNVKPHVDSGYQYASGKDAMARFMFATKQADDYEIRLSYTPHPNRSVKVRVNIKSGDQVIERHINQKLVPGSNGLFQTLGTVSAQAESTIQVDVHGGNAGTTIIDAVQLIPRSLADESKFSGVDDPTLAKLQEALTNRQSMEQQKKLLDEQAPANPDSVMSVREHGEPGDYFVCIRGDAHRLGDPVARHALSVIPLNRDLGIPPQSSGRRELAEWLVDPDNPLTARVYVNRVWAKVFGYGLVRTPDNFGLMGQLPSHPKLLDYLAKHFIQNGWSTKWLIRELATSRVYGLSTVDDPVSLAADPENRLLWRAHRRRLDVEAMRDAILSVSGQLHTEVGGPSIERNLNREFGFEYRSLRRTVYLPVFRNTLNDMLEVFDFPNPNVVSGRRSESTLPAQALFLMNSPFVLDQSRVAAQRILDTELDSDQQRLQLAFRRALGRPPSPAELDMMLQFLREHATENDVQRLNAWTDICHTLFGSLDFRYLD